MFVRSMAASARVIGSYPPGHRGAFRIRAGLPDVARLAAALHARDGQFRSRLRALLRTFDRVFEELYPERRLRWEGLLRWTGLTPIAKATDAAIAELFDCGLPFGADEVGVTTEAGYLPEMLARALDAGRRVMRAAS